MTRISSLDSPYIFEATRDNFDALVLDNSAKGPVLVNYWSPKAGPCLRLYPILDKLVHEFKGKFLLINLNANEHPSVSRQYGVNSLPTVKLFRNRDVVQTMHGYQAENELRQVLNRHVVLDSDLLIGRAVAMFQRDDKTQALTLLAETAIEHPENLRIPLTLAKLLAQEQRHEEAHRLLFSLPAEQRIHPDIRDLLAHLSFLLAARKAPNKRTLEKQVRENTDDLEARYQLCALKLIGDDYQGAMDLLLEILQKDRQFRNGIAADGLLAIFKLLGDKGKLVDRYRRLMVAYTH
ncbi:MAG: tetratricopeptide repeat protein [Pseudomonadota bacterium]